MTQAELDRELARLWTQGRLKVSDYPHQQRLEAELIPAGSVGSLAHVIRLRRLYFMGFTDVADSKLITGGI
jgi:hypothetical protein